MMYVQMNSTPYFGIELMFSGVVLVANAVVVSTPPYGMYSKDLRLKRRGWSPWVLTGVTSCTVDGNGKFTKRKGGGDETVVFGLVLHLAGLWVVGRAVVWGVGGSQRRPVDL